MGKLINTKVTKMRRLLDWQKYNKRKIKVGRIGYKCKQKYYL